MRAILQWPFKSRYILNSTEFCFHNRRLWSVSNFSVVFIQSSIYKLQVVFPRLTVSSVLLLETQTFCLFCYLNQYLALTLGLSFSFCYLNQELSLDTLALLFVLLPESIVCSGHSGFSVRTWLESRAFSGHSGFSVRYMACMESLLWKLRLFCSLCLLITVRPPETHGGRSLSGLNPAGTQEILGNYSLRDLNQVRTQEINC